MTKEKITKLYEVKGTVGEHLQISCCLCTNLAVLVDLYLYAWYACEIRLLVISQGERRQYIYQQT